MIKQHFSAKYLFVLFSLVADDNLEVTDQPETFFVFVSLPETFLKYFWSRIKSGLVSFWSRIKIRKVYKKFFSKNRL